MTPRSMLAVTMQVGLSTSYDWADEKYQVKCRYAKEVLMPAIIILCCSHMRMLMLA